MVPVGDAGARNLCVREREAIEKAEDEKSTNNLSFIKTEASSFLTSGVGTTQKLRENASPLQNSKKGRILKSFAASSRPEVLESVSEKHSERKTGRATENQHQTTIDFDGGSENVKLNYLSMSIEKDLPLSEWKWLLIDPLGQPFFESKATIRVEVTLVIISFDINPFFSVRCLYFYLGLK